MKRVFTVLFLLVALDVSSRAQENTLRDDLQRESDQFHADCSAGGLIAIFHCGKDVFTAQPIHLAVGTIAPQNGFGFGPSFVKSRDTPDWRVSINADAVVSTNASWRAGAYLKAVFAGGKGLSAFNDPKSAASLDLQREFPVMNFFVQAISLNAVDFYGIGPATSRSAEAIFGMRETIAGANILYPLMQREHAHLSLFGELNGRFVDIRDGGSANMALSHLYTNATAPGLANQPGFWQAGEGVRFQPAMFGNHVQPDLSLTYQQFGAPGSKYSFQRLNTNVGVDMPLYHSMIVKTRSYNGPDECGATNCPVAMDRTGSVGLRLVITQSMTPNGNVVPFYFQPTLGGADINGQKLVPAYADYRFRGPNMIAVRANFEHSIYGPLGFQFLYDIGKVAATRSDIDFSHLAHSFATGLTFRAGGMGEVSFLIAFGGGEGTHTLFLMNNSLLGGSARPSLF
jgi:hypothetical protein